MKVSRKILSMLICFAVFMSILPQIAANPNVYMGECGENVTWRYTVSTGSLVISGTGSMQNFETSRQIPWLQFANSMKSVEIADQITSIGSYSFHAYDDGNYQNLTSVIMPDSVHYINENAFYGCRGLTGIELSDELWYIGNKAFGKTGLTSIALPDEVYSIGDYAFYSCHNLTGITLNDGLNYIGNYAFDGMAATHIAIPDTVWSIGSNCFHGCHNLISVTLGSSLASIGAYGFANCTRLSAIYIPDNVTNIGADAFYRCLSLSDVRLPQYITSISRSLFSNCNTLKEIDIPEGVKIIENSAFYGCNQLVNVRIPASVTTIEWYAFGCDELYHILFNGTKEQWNSINIEGNDKIKNALKHYNASGEEVVKGSVTYGEYLYCNICELALSCEHSSAELENQRDATCTEGGYSGDAYCYDCGEYVLQGKETAPLGHNFDGVFCIYCGEANPEMIINNPFVDVKVSDYFFTPVLWAVQKGITNGISATEFGPNANCTRGQIVTFLWRACGSPEPEKTDNPFTDVKSADYYYKAVLWAVESGITNGMGATTFEPNATCTRGQVATFLWRSQGKPAPESDNNSFNDVRNGEYYYDAVLWAVENNITNGTDVDTFSPDASCTRGQIVTFLYRALAK